MESSEGFILDRGLGALALCFFLDTMATPSANSLRFIFEVKVELLVVVLVVVGSTSVIFRFNSLDKL